VDGRVVDGVSRITEILSLHAGARRVLWPYAYTKADVPYDMSTDDHAVLAALAKGISSRDGYPARQAGDVAPGAGDPDASSR